MTVERSIWLVSDGRSGSTWLSSLLNHRGSFSEYFEPLHMHFTPQLSNELLIPYARPGKLPQLYRDFYSGVFSKTLLLPRSGPSSPERSLLLAKDIHALLIAKAVSCEFPSVDVICLVRDPIEVASSKLTLNEWKWFREPKQLLENEELREDWLRSHEELIQNAETQFQKYIVLWAIMHFVFLHQFDSDEIIYLYYKDSFAVLKEKLDAILSRVAVTLDPAKFRTAYYSRSTTDLIETPRYRPSPSEREYAVSVIQAFGLTALFNQTQCSFRDRMQWRYLRDAARSLTPAKARAKFRQILSERYTSEE